MMEEKKEQIIVDNVDVTECMERFKHSGKDKQLCKYLSTLLTCRGRDCYFKQKVRLEQQLQLKDKEIKKLNKMIELMAIDGMNSVEYIFKYYKQQALAELEE